MLNKINGLPAHVLLIHVVIAVVPLAALLVVLHALWPAARRRLGVVTPLVALIALVVVPITTSAGHYLKNYLINERHFSGALKARIITHANLGSTFLWFVIPLFVVAAGLWYLGRRYDYGLIPDRRSPRGTPDDSAGNGSGATLTAVRPQARTSRRSEVPAWASVVIAVVAVVVAVLNVIQLYRIGDSGAHSVWNDTFAH